MIYYLSCQVKQTYVRGGLMSANESIINSIIEMLQDCKDTELLYLILSLLSSE